MKPIDTILGCVFGASLIAIIVLVVLDDPKAKVSAMQKRFESMPNVKLTHISDLTKQASQVITAEIEVVGKGEMSFTGLGTTSFQNSSRIRLSGIGPYNFRTREFIQGQEWCGYDIDIGAASPIPAARDLKITSVQEAIAHYDELLALVAHWPVTTNEWPSNLDDMIRFVDAPKGDYYFCLKR